MKFNIDENLKFFSGIYIIKNSLDERFYIGSTRSFYERYQDHVYSFRKKCHANKYMQAFVNKYGIKRLSFELLSLCKNTCLQFNEELLIRKLKPQFNIKHLIQRAYLKDDATPSLDSLRDAIEKADRKIAEKLFKETGKIWICAPPDLIESQQSRSLAL